MNPNDAFLALSNTTDAPPFCKSSMGGGMIMYMEGFKFSLANPEPCLNLFFPSWTLDSKEKFYTAMLGVFVVSVLLEGLSSWRYHIVKAIRQQLRSGGRGGGGTSTPLATGGLRLVVTLLHGFQGLLGYLIMLAVMTYSLELLLAVVLGLALGYAIFFQYEEALARVHVTTNPCCAFLKGEAREAAHEDDDDDNAEEDATTPLLQQGGTLITEPEASPEQAGATSEARTESA